MLNTESAEFYSAAQRAADKVKLWPSWKVSGLQFATVGGTDSMAKKKIKGQFTKYTEAAGLDLVRETWEQLKYEIRPIGYKIFVRTMPHVKMSNGIWLSPREQSFHGQIKAHLVIVRATVLSCGTRGPAVEFNPGDVVEFQRLNFGFVERLFGGGNLEDSLGEVYVGFLDANHVLWKVESDDE
jgi:hypothetical protein